MKNMFNPKNCNNMYPTKNYGRFGRPTSPFNVLFDENFLSDFATNQNSAIAQPKTNIKETPVEFVIELAAPGMEKSDFKINLEENNLIISAEKKEQKLEENEKFTRKEFHFNAFKRAFTLPETLDTELIEATYNNGILSIHLPKKAVDAKVQKKEIAVS